jgi:hypothetical protein
MHEWCPAKLLIMQAQSLKFYFRQEAGYGR